MAMEATRTVLVIEDDAILRELLDEVLSDAGYRVVQAADADHALSLAAAERPVLILLDFVLPDRPGADVLVGLKQGDDTGHIPIIALSGLPESRGDGPLPPDAWISKPFDLDVLLAQVGRLAGGLPWTPPSPALAEPARSNAAGRVG